jgi:hypothetical protein
VEAIREAEGRVGGVLESQLPWKRDCKFSDRDIPQGIIKK